MAMELPQLICKTAAQMLEPMAALHDLIVGGGSASTCLLLLIILSLLLLLLVMQHPKQLKLPPSPFPCLPFLGHVFHLHHIGRTSALTALRNKLGPIFTLHVGSTPLIYITSCSLAHEALITNGLLFAARPLFRSREIFTNNLRNINSSPCAGPYWRALRRNLVQEMLAVPKLSAFKSIRDRVLDDMMSSILVEVHASSEGVVSIYAQFRDAMVQLFFFMCFGFHSSKETRLDLSLLTDEVLSLSGTNLEDFYPFLHVFTGKRRAKAHAVRANQVKLYTAFIDKHTEMQKLGQLATGSYLESLLNFDASSPLSIDDLIALCSEFMSVGTDTTVTTVEWAMARLVENPYVQQNLYDEIQQVAGDKQVGEKDLQRCTYLQAVIKETLRLHPPVHFLLPHSTSKLCKIGGYDVPPGTTVMFPLLLMAKDAEIWKEPMKFNPERFVGANGDNISSTGSKDIRGMMPFGAGRRICPGIAMASLHMELFIARLVQAFEWSIPSASSSTIDFSERAVFTVRMQTHLTSLVKERTAKYN